MWHRRVVGLSRLMAGPNKGLMECPGPELPELIRPTWLEVCLERATCCLAEWLRPLLNQLPPRGIGSSLRLRERRGRLRRAIHAWLPEPEADAKRPMGVKPIFGPRPCPLDQWQQPHWNDGVVSPRLARRSVCEARSQRL
eukprot:15450263-Alexandrium_andersonii.AAC.1